MKRKLSIKKYAQLFLELTAGRQKDGMAEIVKKFALFLKRNAALALADQILAEYEKMFLAGEGKTKLEIQTGYALSAKNKKALVKMAKIYFKQDNFEVEESVLDGVRGGAILRSDNKILNLSLDWVLGVLENNMAK